MASTTLQVRVDAQLKTEAARILSSVGLNMTDAVRLFLNRIVMAQGLPFPMNKNIENEEFQEFIANSNTAVFDPVEYLNQIEISESKSNF